MARTDTLIHYLQDIAQTLRDKTGTTDLIPPKDFDRFIEDIAPRVDVNGLIKEYTLQGDSVKSGDFITKIDDNTVKLLADASDIILGIAAQNGEDGDIIQVFYPNTVVPQEVSISHNQGDSGYGFIQTTDNTWVSNNKGLPLSYSKCRLVFKTWKTMKVDVYARCYTTDSEDRGYLGALDTTLAPGNQISESDEIYRIPPTEEGKMETYTIPGDGESHYIEIKYRKDGKDNEGEDCLYFYYTNIRYVENDKEGE